ncbi:hypothetical protein SCUCBS95973_005617 [Sporothrix curviconia]|uniref:N-glycosylation protein EOS1 n=1 Tax=Sporothrix curviconia TaxID=1260050 RepID=A0ABP0BZ68_9PEZI
MSSSPTSGLPPYFSTPITNATSSSSSPLPTASPATAGTPVHRKTVRFQTADHDNKNKIKYGLPSQQHMNNSSGSLGPGSSPIPPAGPPLASQRAWYGAPPAERAGSTGANGGFHAAVVASLAGAGFSQSPLGNGSGNHYVHQNQNQNQNHSHNYNNGSNNGLSSGPPSYDGGDTDRSNGNSNNGGAGGGSAGSSSGGGGGGDDDDDGQVARPSLLQPRVAVVLGLPSLWHLPLFACRSLSVCPAIWWSLGIFIRLLAQLHALALARSGFGGPDAKGGGGIGGNAFGSMPGVGSLAAAASSSLSNLPDRGSGLSLESRLKLTETALAMIWCGASAYLSFFFTDCLMSRWLLNYTPQATIVRLLAINALNGYLTSWVIYLMGSGGDSRLLLPAWVAIAAILTGLYHGTQRKINIRKETSISISVFSGASFISMVSLLAQLYWDRPEYVDVPVVALARRVCTETARVAGNLFDIGNITMDL